MNNTKRTRLTIDIPPEAKRRLRLAAARRDLSIRQYVLKVIEEKLTQDLAGLAEEEGLVALSARTDPVLAELWDNERDGAYDRL